MQVEDGAHEAMKEGIGALPGPDVPAPLPLPSLGSPSSKSSFGMVGNPLPTSSAMSFGLGEQGSSVMSTGLDDCDEEETKDLSWKVKRAENLLKVGLQTLMPMEGHKEDCHLGLEVKPHTPQKKS